MIKVGHTELSNTAAACSGIRVSGDTLLNILRRAPVPERPAPSVLGVDDWSYKRGVRFGTILVDLEHHLPVELLPDRSSDSFAHWLVEHPGIGVIARDRGEIYAEGARQGAPEEVQVADRWHLLKNLSEAVERFLQREHTQLEAATEGLRAEAVAAIQLEQVETEPPQIPTKGPTKVEQRKLEIWMRRKARYDRVVELRQLGHSYEAIAREVGLSKMTVMRYLRMESLPQDFGTRKHRYRLLDAYEVYLEQEWNQGVQNAAELWRRLTDKGLRCSRATVGRYVQHWRPSRGKPGKPAKSVKPKPTPRALPPRWPSYTPRRATWLLLRPQNELSKDAAC